MTQKNFYQLLYNVGNDVENSDCAVEELTFPQSSGVGKNYGCN